MESHPNWTDLLAVVDRAYINAIDDWGNALQVAMWARRTLIQLPAASETYRDLAAFCSEQAVLVNDLQRAIRNAEHERDYWHQQRQKQLRLAKQATA